jgi:ribosomal protein L6P/L9E
VSHLVNKGVSKMSRIGKLPINIPEKEVNQMESDITVKGKFGTLQTPEVILLLKMVVS